MKVKTRYLTGLGLAWAVAQSRSVPVTVHDDGITRCLMRLGDHNSYAGRFEPEADGALCMAIVNETRMQLTTVFNQDLKEPETFGAFLDDGRDFIDSMEVGPTAEVALLRCFVASKLGDEVEIPDELASDALGQ